eukprot:4899381-Amphidinium_carterae.1
MGSVPTTSMRHASSLPSTSSQPSGSMGGPKGKGRKGGTSAEVPLHPQVRDVLPEAGVLRSQATLVQTDWDATCLHPQQLSASGGVALCPEALIPRVVAQVGASSLPVAILHTRAAREVGLEGYPTRKVMVRITPPELDEPVFVHRYLTQLGFGNAVQQQAVGPEVALAVVQSKVVVSFPEDHWGAAITPALVAGWVDARVPTGSYELVTCRTNSAVVAALLPEAELLLKASGQEQVYVKHHVSEAHTCEVLWMQAGHAECLSLVQHALPLGVVRKVFQHTPTYGLRFKSQPDLTTWAQERGIVPPPALGVFTAQGFPEGTTVVQLYEALAPNGWEVEELMHQDSKGLTFAASRCGQNSELHRRQA